MERVALKLGDITAEKTQAIVNAANTTLLGGGGVDGAIHRAAGPQLLEECRTLGGCRTGQAKLTKGYHLKARYVIHVAGPVWSGGDHGEDELLADCYRNALTLALEHKITTIAFPAISTGAYRFPLERATRIAVTTTCAFLREHPSIEQVVFVCYNQQSFDAYKKALAEKA
jgi:O-acetyl-ADP-ribose deacetylase (regulator of RNase III)